MQVYLLLIIICLNSIYDIRDIFNHFLLKLLCLLSNRSIQFRIFLLTYLLTFYLMVIKNQGILTCGSGNENEAYDTLSHSSSSKLSSCKIFTQSNQVTLLMYLFILSSSIVLGLNLMFRFWFVDHQKMLLDLSHRVWPLQIQSTLAFQAIDAATIFKRLFDTWFLTISVSSQNQHL